MNSRPALSTTIIIAALLLASCSDTSLLFQVQDAVSGAAVWEATARLQGRLLTSYYQTDAGPVPQRISHLSPGAATLRLSAPGYQPVSVDVRLHRGKNSLARPVAMVGTEIPGLAGFSVFETVESGGFSLQLRPLDAAGAAISHHPCIDLWVAAVVSEQVVDGVPAAAEGGRGAARGRVLFRGAVPWSWDARPESLFRYTARIASSDMNDAPSLYRVIDYLIVAPDPARITRAELDSRMAAAWSGGGLVDGNPARSAATRPAAGLSAALDAMKGSVRYFLVTSWDVRARQS